MMVACDMTTMRRQASAVRPDWKALLGQHDEVMREIRSPV
jgi:hypothetical protein